MTPQDSRRSLPLLDPRVLRDLDFPRIQTAVAQRAHTPAGQAHAAALPLLEDAPAVVERLTTVSQLMAVAVEDMSWPSLSGVADLTESLRLAQRDGVLDGLALRTVAATLDAGERAANWCAARRARAPQVARVVEAFGDYGGLVREVDRSVEPSGRLSDQASPQLGELRRRAAGMRETLAQRMEHLVREFDSQGLLQDQFHTLREDRYVLPVKANERWRVAGIVHDTSQTHQTFFIEPQEVVDLGNRLKAAQADVAEEEARILRALSGKVGARSREITADLEALHRLDVIAASAKFGVDLGCHVPQLSAPDGEGGLLLALRAFRHPVLTLDMLARKQTPAVVPNDIFVGQPHVLVITGPNTGGKTVALKGAGLCALMVRAGLPIPASPDSVMPLYDRIHSVVGDGQSLEDGLSSFGAHLAAIGQMLAGVSRAAAQGQRVLCVLDEVMSGTDPDQGAALAQATLEHLSQQGAHVVATTHFEKLKVLALEDHGAKTFRNASVGLEPDTMRPTYRLRYDAPGSSSALDMAVRLGLPLALVDRARTLASEGGQRLDVLLKNLAQQQAALDEERAAVARAHEEARRAEQTAQHNAESIKETEKELKRKAREGMLAETQRVRAQLQEAVEHTRSALAAASAGAQPKENLSAALGHLARVGELQEALLRDGENDRRAEAAGRAFDAPLATGSRVHVLTLNVEGEVLELGAKDVLVAAGALRVRVPLKDLAPPRRGKPPPPPVVTRRPDTGDVVVVARSLDLRGEHVDEALERVEIFLDRAFGKVAGELTIVHGHGTGVLRKVLREKLDRHPLVASHRRGRDDEGGNGATVVTLKQH